MERDRLAMAKVGDKYEEKMGEQRAKEFEKLMKTSNDSFADGVACTLIVLDHFEDGLSGCGDNAHEFLTNMFEKAKDSKSLKFDLMALSDALMEITATKMRLGYEE